MDRARDTGDGADRHPRSRSAGRRSARRTRGVELAGADRVKLRKREDTPAPVSAARAGKHSAHATVPAHVEGNLAPAPAVDRPDDWQSLGDILIGRQAVSHTQLNEALLQQSASGKR